MKKIKYIGLMLFAVGFSACDVDNKLDEIPEVPVVYEEPTSGTADFSNYVAIGASFTAGVSDGSLFLAAQSRSFPSIMASKMTNMGGGSFTQPLISDNIGGMLLSGNQILPPRLYFYSDQDETDAYGSGPYPTGVVPHLNDFTPELPTTDVTNILSGPFNNYGIPGAKSFHMVAAGYGNVTGIGTTANPYFVRMTPTANAATATVLGAAAAEAPTFFTISEIGGNDVLQYATSGGTGVVQTGNLDPTTYGLNDITDPSVFANVFNTMVTTLTANGAKGVVVTVPSIANLPHFTTVPHNPIPLDATSAAQVNAAYAAYNGGLQLAVQGSVITQAEADRRTINFSAGANAVVIEDEYLTAVPGLPNYRQATADDLLVLPALSFISSTNGVSVPLADKWVLTPEEQNNIQTAIDAYNATINAVGSANGLAIVDLNQVLTEASSASGTSFDDFTMTTSFVFGGLVSLDGIHLTSRGYALMANKILEAIDDTYGSNFVESGNLANANDYPTNYPSGI